MNDSIKKEETHRVEVMVNPALPSAKWEAQGFPFLTFEEAEAFRKTLAHKYPKTRITKTTVEVVIVWG